MADKTKTPATILSDVIRKQFPKVFPSNGRQALAVGIKEQIAAEFPKLDRAVLDEFLKQWTRGWGYRGALAAEGAVRMNLDGSPQGPVEEPHRQRAIRQLGKRKAAHSKTPATAK